MVSLSTFLVIGATPSLVYNIVGHAKTVGGRENGWRGGRRAGDGQGQWRGRELAHCAVGVNTMRC